MSKRKLMDDDPNDPTAEEIAARCQAIRDSWSPVTRERRRNKAYDPVPWSVPEVSCDFYAGDGDEENPGDFHTSVLETGILEVDLML